MITQKIPSPIAATLAALAGAAFLLLVLRGPAPAHADSPSTWRPTARAYQSLVTLRSRTPWTPPAPVTRSV